MFYEANFDTPRTVEYVTFDPGFGVRFVFVFSVVVHRSHSVMIIVFCIRFGLFTCFDILFKEPGIVLAEHGVRDFAYPTAWVKNEPPFLMSLEVLSSTLSLSMDCII